MNNPTDQAVAVQAIRNASAEQLEELLSVLAASAPRHGASTPAPRRPDSRARAVNRAAGESLVAPADEGRSA